MQRALERLYRLSVLKDHAGQHVLAANGIQRSGKPRPRLPDDFVGIAWLPSPVTV